MSPLMRRLSAMLALSLSTLAFVGFQPLADAACPVNAGGYCEGTCDVNVLATCWSSAGCTVNALAVCGDDVNSASCLVNAGQATCTGFCTVNAGDATCSGSCLANAGAASCSGWCAVNAGLATCTGGCLVNVGAATCDSTSCEGSPICFLWGCTVNALVADCHEGGACRANVAADCWGGCAANLASPSGRSSGSVIIDLGCGSEGSCTVNVAARCDGACAVNAVLATCNELSQCTVNVVATCSALDEVLP